MSEAKTKACNLTEGEIRQLIFHHGAQTVYGDIDEGVERINYLNKRLKTFSEPDQSNEVKPAPMPSQPAPASGW